MPRAPLSCPTPTCHHTQPCPHHQRQPWAGSTRHATLPSNWNHFRQQRFTLDNWTCVDCGHHDPTGRTLECDHIGHRDDHRLDALRTRCGPRANDCHGNRTRQQAAAARRGGGPPHPPHHS